jgi:anti-sigma factor RsiW
MKLDISQRDWQELSEYIDQQLSSRAQMRLEARLQTEPLLRRALEDIRRNRVLLLSQTRLPVPCNFTLTPQMVNIRRANPAYPVFRLAAAMASILLVLVLAGDLISGGPVRTTYQDVLSPFAARQVSQPVEEAVVVTVEMEAAQPMAKSLPEVAEPGTAESQPVPSLAATPPIQESLFPTSPPPTEESLATQQAFTTPEPTPLPAFSLANLALLGIELLLALLAVLAWLAAIVLGR